MNKAAMICAKGLQAETLPARHIGGRAILGDKPELACSRQISKNRLNHTNSSSKKRWAQVPSLIREDVERHVFSHLPAEMLEKLHDLQARGMSIDSDPAFFHFGGGMAVRNLCRERVNDNELAAHGLLCNWDECYIGVLSAIAAMRQ